MALITYFYYSQNCWNCGRRATETCSGCNKARYCGTFCQHKDWANHMHHCASGIQGMYRQTDILLCKYTPSHLNLELWPPVYYTWCAANRVHHYVVLPLSRSALFILLSLSLSLPPLPSPSLTSQANQRRLLTTPNICIITLSRAKRSLFHQQAGGSP